MTLAGCGNSESTLSKRGPAEDSPTKEETKSALTLGTRDHLMPMHGTVQPAATLTSTLLYYGGKVVPNVKVYNLNWSSSVTTTIKNGMPAFYAGVTNSVYFDWLSEYNTAGKNGQDGQPGSNQTIGRGTLGGTFTFSPSVTSTSITDAQIQTEISKQIASGVLPAPDDNAYYPVNFPANISITSSDGSKSCVQFCAYHGTFKIGNQNVYYGVLPSVESGACSSGCGSNATALNNATSVASHEMIETVTDAEVGLGTTVSRPLAWYDATSGEIGDICNASQGTVLGGDGVTYTVQAEYDNATKTCIVSKASTANDFSVGLSPASGTVAPGASKAFTVTTGLVSGTAQSVALSVSGLPSGVTGSLSPTSVTAGQSSTLTLTAAANATAITQSFTVTGSAGATTHTTSGSLTVSGTTGGDVVLQNGVAVAGVSGALNSQTFFQVAIPAGATNLVVSISGTGTGDADLYTHLGSHPTLTTYDCRPYLGGSNESCTVAAPAPGTYYVMLNGYAAYTGVSVKATWSTGGGGGGDTQLTNNVALTGLSGAKGAQTFYQLAVPAGTASVTFTITGSTSSTNDTDLYVKANAHPSLTSYDCRPFKTGSNETCTIANPVAGTYDVMLNGYSAYSGVTLKGSY